MCGFVKHSDWLVAWGTECEASGIGQRDVLLWLKIDGPVIRGAGKHAIVLVLQHWYRYCNTSTYQQYLYL